MKSFSNNHIDAHISGSYEGKWRFTGFYGHPVAKHRSEGWELLRKLHRENTLSWLCAGDFNAIICDDEKWGGSLRSVRQMKDFRTVIQDCNFQELSFTGSKFTWSRNERI